VRGGAEVSGRDEGTDRKAEEKGKRVDLGGGRAIKNIGWDDDLEIPMRDGQGKPVLDASGKPRTEKGFWLFKNSWGTAGFGINHPYGPGYGWLSYRYVQEYGSAVVADLPSLPTCPSEPCTGGGTPRTYTKSAGAAIADWSTVTSTINVTDAGTLADVKLTVDIEHTYQGDLRLTLSKGPDSFVVFDRSGGSTDNLKQTFSVTGLVSKSLTGTWTLQVEDLGWGDIGTLKSWTLEVRTN